MMQQDQNGNIIVDGIAFLPDFFVYELDFAAVAPTATPNSSITIQAGSHFIWQQGVYDADIAAAAFLDNTRPIPNISLAIVDSGSGRSLTSANVPVPSLFGTAQLPYVLPAPRLFKASSQIGITLLNYDAAITYNLKLSFIGLKLFQLPANQQPGAQG